MARVAIKALHVRGQNARPIMLYVMKGVSRINSAGGTSSKSTASDANSEMSSLSGGAFPNGIEFNTTRAGGHDSGVVATKAYGSKYSRVISQSEMAPGDKIVLENGSYILIYASSFTAGSYNISGACTMVLRYYTKDDELAYSGDYSFDVSYNIPDNTNRHYFMADFLPWKTELYNNTYYLYRCYVISDTVQTMGVDVPQYRCYWRGSADPVNASLGIKFFDGIPEYDPDDPYPDIPDVVPDPDPDPDPWPDDDPIDIPDLPDISVVDSGFITLYNPTIAQLQNLAAYMWSSLFDINSLRKLFADPMDCILGLNLLPVTIPNGNVTEVAVGNISTTVRMNKASSQWVEKDCGTIHVGKPYGNYMDFAPYSKYSIYLPFIGTEELSTDDIVGKDLHVVYHVDILSCACVCYLKCGSHVLYQFAGSCGYQIPVSGNDFRNTIAGIIDIVAGVAGAAVTGGTSGALSGFSSVAHSALNMKPEVHRSGTIGSAVGIMGMLTPYLIQEIPRVIKPASQYKYTGYPSFCTVSLGSISGYAEFESVILDAIPCTEEEKDLIFNMCEGGIYL